MVNQIVTASEIMDLDDMKCYLRLPGSYPVTLLDLVLNKRDKIAKDFMLNDFDIDDEIEGLVDSNDSKVRNFCVKKTTNETTNPDDLDDAAVVESEQNTIATETSSEGVVVTNDDDIPDDVMEIDQKQEVIWDE